MATTRQIRDALKSVFDLTGAFGSVYTRARKVIENPNPAAIIMWHDGGHQEPQAGQSVSRTTDIVVNVIIPQGPLSGEEEMQDLADDKLEVVLDALRRNPHLDTGAGPLVFSAFPDEWEISYDKENKRMVVAVNVAVTREEG